MALWSSSRRIPINYFGDGSDGSYTTTGNVSHAVSQIGGSAYDGDILLKQYKNLTISSGHIMTTSQPCRGMFIYVAGNCIIDGTLTMSSRGAFSGNPASVTNSSDGNSVGASGLQIGMKTSGGSDTFTADGTSFNGCGSSIRTAYANQPNLEGDGTIWTVPRIGGAGGAGNDSQGYGQRANVGGTLSNGTGGGGAGAGHNVSSYVAYGGDGTAGTCFSGGTGGGGGGDSSESTTLKDAVPYGGAGGNGDGWHGGSGAGNPGGTPSYSHSPYEGEDGTGGLLILVVGGTLSGTGTIAADGNDGGDGHASTFGGAGAGSGAGKIICLYVKKTFSGTMSVAGGLGGDAWSDGGHGGAGDIDDAQVLFI